MEHNCPVCNKGGLPDYTVIHTVCPQCDSDLKPFLLIHSIEKANRPYKYMAWGLSLSIIILAILFINSSFQKHRIVNEKVEMIKLYEDSLAGLRSIRIPASKELQILYKVKNGDYPAKIAAFFYNDWKKYKDIERTNNLKQPYILRTGQTLIIKIKQE